MVQDESVPGDEPPQAPVNIVSGPTKPRIIAQACDRPIDFIDHTIGCVRVVLGDAKPKRIEFTARDTRADDAPAHALAIGQLPATFFLDRLGAFVRLKATRNAFIDQGPQFSGAMVGARYGLALNPATGQE